MRAAKVIGLGILFSFAGFVILTVISLASGRAFETSHATALSAVVGSILEGLFNPATWLVVIVAFVAATWLTRKTSKRTSAS